MRMIVSNDGKLKHQFPHTSFGYKDMTRISAPKDVAKDIGAIVIPFFSPKGVDREYVTFTPEQVNRVRDVFGKPNIRSQGFAYAAVHKTLRAGGKVVGMRLTPDNAAYSNSALRLTSTITEVPVFHITDNGEFYTEAVEGSQPVLARSLKFTYGQSFAAGVTDIEILDAMGQPADGLQVYAAGDDVDTNGMERSESHTLYTFLAAGRGRYGDAFKVTITPTPYIENGKKLFELEVVDTSTGIVLENRQVTHHTELTVDTTAMSIPEVIKYYSDHLKVHTEDEKLFALGDRIKSVLELTLKDLNEVLENGVYQGISLNPESIAKLSEVVNDIRSRIAIMEEEAAQPSQNFIEIFAPERGSFGKIYSYGDVPAFRLGGGSNGDLDQMKLFNWKFKPTIKNIAITPKEPATFEFIDLGKLGVEIDGNQVDDTSVIWRSSNPDIKVGPDGQLTNVKNEAGIRAVISVQTVDGNHRAYKQVLTVSTGASRAALKQASFAMARNAEDENIQEPGVPEKLMQNYFNGVYGVELYNIEITKGDVIMDFDYPNSVKLAASNFVKDRRIDIGVIVNAPLDCNTIDDIKRWVKDFDPENDKLMKVMESGDAFDVESKRYIKMPATYVMIDDVVAWLNAGYAEGLAGETVMVREFQRGTIRPLVAEDEHLDYLTEHNINYLTLTKNGYMLDGQATNIKGGVYSRMKEFHNIVILGRVMKKLAGVLQLERHKLNIPGATIGAMQKNVNSELEEFRPKVAGLQYIASFANDYEEKIGLITHDIDIMPHGTLKYHRVNVNVLFQNAK